MKGDKGKESIKRGEEWSFFLLTILYTLLNLSTNSPLTDSPLYNLKKQKKEKWSDGNSHAIFLVFELCRL